MILPAERGGGTYYGRIRNGMDDLQFAQTLFLSGHDPDSYILVVHKLYRYGEGVSIVLLPPGFEIPSVDGGLELSDELWQTVIEIFERLEQSDDNDTG